MNTFHKASLPALGLLVALVLTGCSLLTPSPPAPPVPSPTVVAIPAEDFNDTTWSGTDSGGTVTTFILHAGGSTAVTFSGNVYDDPADTWALEGTTLTISISNVSGKGDATYVGEVTDSAGPIDLNLTFADVTETRTLTIVKG